MTPQFFLPVTAGTESAGQRTPLRHASDVPKGVSPIVQYESLKQIWLLANPEATPAEHTAAMREIARKAGV